MKTINSAEEFSSFISGDSLVLVLFTTHDCSTCVPIEKKIEERFSELPKRKVFIDDVPSIKGHLGVFTVPVVCLYVNSQEVGRFVRVFSINEIEERVARLKELI